MAESCLSPIRATRQRDFTRAEGATAQLENLSMREESAERRENFPLQRKRRPLCAGRSEGGLGLDRTEKLVAVIAGLPAPDKLPLDEKNLLVLAHVQDFVR